MTIDDVRLAIADIKSEKWDSEVRHIQEDKLRADFIAYIATLGIAGVSDVAAEVLKTDEIQFTRWYA